MMGNLQSEVQAAQQRRDQLKADIAADTETLMAKQASELAYVQKNTAEHLATVRREAYEAEKQAKVKIKARTDEVAKLDSQITAKTAELEASHSRLGRLQTEIQSAQHELERLTATTVGASVGLAQVQADVTALLERQSNLAADCATAHEELTLTQDALRMAREKYVQDNEVATRELTNLSHRSEDLMREIQRDEKQWKDVREDLALRHTKLNEREAVLERREIKVARDERNLARNVDLLSL